MTETILLVEDEVDVRRTILGWLTRSDLGCTVLEAADEVAALRLADQQPIDLAILDWNLGTGYTGLELLQDLVGYSPDIVAILITGYAQKTTPLDAMRMGVRDYLDKNQEFTEIKLLDAVRKQLNSIRPIKQRNEFQRRVVAFRDAVQQILPLVQSTSAMNEPVPLPEAVRTLLRFVMRTTKASDAVLLVRHLSQQQEQTQLYGATGELLSKDGLVPFSQSLAASVVSMQDVYLRNSPIVDEAVGIRWQPFERGRSNLLATSLSVGPGIQVVIELFDKATPGFTDDDRRVLATAGEIGSELLRHALAERQSQRLLFDAVAAALDASDHVTQEQIATPHATEKAISETILDRLRSGLNAGPVTLVDGEQAVRLAEVVRQLAIQHGNAAVEHCIQVIRSTQELLNHLLGDANG
ncbi:response regulator [Tuwongella immobilis]|nr:response regulator [Tuwongella immobilis]